MNSSLRVISLLKHSQFPLKNRIATSLGCPHSTFIRTFTSSNQPFKNNPQSVEEFLSQDPTDKEKEEWLRSHPKDRRVVYEERDQIISENRRRNKRKRGLSKDEFITLYIVYLFRRFG